MSQKSNQTQSKIPYNPKIYPQNLQINLFEEQLKGKGKRKSKNNTENDNRQEKTAILSLLDIKDQQNEEWKQKLISRQHQNQSKASKKNYSNKSLIKYQDQWQRGHIKIDQLQNLQNDNQRHFKKVSNLNQKIVEKDNLEKEVSYPYGSKQQLKQQFLKQNFKNKFFMSRTNYWSKTKKTESKGNFLNQRPKNSQTSKTSTQFYPTSQDRLRVNSHLGFHKPDDQPQLPKSSHSIRISSNKSFTVRQMLRKISSKSDISLQNEQITQNFSKLKVRRPFDPYYRSQKQHYKKFTPFRTNQQKKVEQSLTKLQQHLRNNPQLFNEQEQIQIKYLEKPIYCAWVERNKHLGKKIPLPPTIRPLQLS